MSTGSQGGEERREWEWFQQRTGSLELASLSGRADIWLVISGAPVTRCDEVVLLPLECPFSCCKVWLEELLLPAVIGPNLIPVVSGVTIATCNVPAEYCVTFFVWLSSLMLTVLNNGNLVARSNLFFVVLWWLVGNISIKVFFRLYFLLPFYKSYTEVYGSLTGIWPPFCRWQVRRLDCVVLVIQT